MEIIHIYVFLTAIFSIFVAAVKLEENQKLKKEIRVLREKLGRQ